MKVEAGKMLDKHNELNNLDPNDEDEDEDELDDSFGNSLDQGLSLGKAKILGVSIADDDEEDKDKPEFVYHASPAANIQDIQTNGLISMGRKFVHLHPDKSKAIEAAKRHDDDIRLFEINMEDLESYEDPIKKDFGFGDVYLVTAVLPGLLIQIPIP